MLQRLLALSWDSTQQRCASDRTCRLLRRELALVGREFESLPYARLLESAEALSFTRIVGGVQMSFSAEAYQVDRNGDLHFCIDATARPNRTGWQPSYRFVKRRDGSVYY